MNRNWKELKSRKLGNNRSNLLNRVNAASELEVLRGDVEAEIKEILEFDYQFTLGCFAYSMIYMNPS
jgi:hypothetical protein